MVLYRITDKNTMVDFSSGPDNLLIAAINLLRSTQNRHSLRYAETGGLSRSRNSNALWRKDFRRQCAPRGPPPEQDRSDRRIRRRWRGNAVISAGLYSGTQGGGVRQNRANEIWTAYQLKQPRTYSTKTAAAHFYP